MRVLFMGTPDFAVPSLEALAQPYFLQIFPSDLHPP